MTKKVERATSMNNIQYRFAPLRLLPLDKTIMFGKVNLLRFTRLHEDTLILIVNVVNYNVCRILIDQGSSTNLFHFSACEQLKLPMTTLESLGRALKGFKGSTTIFLCDIILSMVVGLVTLMAQFLVFKDPFPYNTILGQAWINKMKAVSSTYHQKVSYLTTQGQINILGDQTSSKRCY